MGGRVALALAGALLLAACASTAPAVPAWEPIPEPEPAEVESVVFLVGDAGLATEHNSPLMRHLRSEVDAWSSLIARDSAVAVVYLGDIVYPRGLHPPGSPEFPGDSAVVQAQVDVVGGPAARRRRALALFTPGNHDWGEQTGAEGTAWLERLEAFLDRARARGPEARLTPPAGQGGPVVIDMGGHLRLLILDTAWWLLGPTEGEKADVLARVRDAMETAGDRTVLLAAHHPWTTGGEHGGLVPFWRTLGVRWLLARTGALLQDLSSPPYRALIDGLRLVFRETGPPLIHAGGHDHSLQVIRDPTEFAPAYTLVSGSASKLSSAGAIEGTRFHASKPGYMRVTVLRDGSVDLFVVAAPEAYLLCGPGWLVPEDTVPADVADCIADGEAAFDVVWSANLRGPAGGVP